jgi:putative Mg2+ transporter-C (MgtC) family protein
MDFLFWELDQNIMSWQLLLELLLRIVAAGICGAIIGLERSKRLKEAGLRTHCVVAVAAALIMVLSKHGFPEAAAGDPARLAAQIVSGIGFLGAGVIFKNGNVVRGITTAAGIWATAAIGMAFGAGMYLIGLFTTAFIMLVQILLHKFPVGNDIHNTNEIIIVMVDTPASRDIIHNKLKHEWGIVVSTHAYREEDGRRMVQLSVKATSTMTPDKMMEMLDKYPDIVSIST